jgi:hypothetical protein
MTAEKIQHDDDRFSQMLTWEQCMLMALEEIRVTRDLMNDPLSNKYNPTLYKERMKEWGFPIPVDPKLSEVEQLTHLSQFLEAWMEYVLDSGHPLIEGEPLGELYLQVQDIWSSWKLIIDAYSLPK